MGIDLRPLFCGNLAGFALSGLVFQAAISCAYGLELQPHIVVYEMDLVSATHGSGVSMASGSMSYKLQENCQSWSTETHVALRIRYAERGDVDSDWSFVSRESKDGLSYRFRVLHSIGSALVENYKGRVTKKTVNAAAIAHYSVPDGMIAELTSETLFPTKHLIELIGASKYGKRIFRRTVFDGTSINNPYEVNAVLGLSGMSAHSKRRVASQLFDQAGLNQAPVLHVQMAFFPVGSKGAEPEFELSVEYRDDGIARFIKQDFGGFVLALNPRRIQLLNTPEC